MDFTAQWIWTSASRVHDYNTTALFKREFRLEQIDSAQLAVTADSWYRLKINGEWINDGPCRSYPSHYQYDLIDVTAALRPGINIIEAVVRYFGIGTFHQIPQQAGFLAQLEVRSGSEMKVIGTDSSWQAAEFLQMVPNTAKVAIQQEPFELYDATRLTGEFHPATVLFPAGEGPWQGLNPRDCRLLSRKEFNLKRFVSASRTQSAHWSFSIPAQKLLYPGTTTSNFMTSQACGAAFRVTCPDNRGITIVLDNLRCAVNGVPVMSGRADLRAGDNLLLLLVKDVFTHRKDLSISIPEADGLRFENPLNGGDGTVCFLRFTGLLRDGVDIPFMNHRPENRVFEAHVNTIFDPIMTAGDLGGLDAIPGMNIEHLPSELFSQDDAHWHFRDRRPEPVVAGDVVDAENMLYVIGDVTVINPVAGKDIELLFDLGEQNCGYWDFELVAERGTLVDVFAVEHIAANGDIQHTADNRNGLRYVCRDGVNRHLSYKRRSGRFIFITLRNQRSQVRFNFFRLIESTYPVEYKGSFECSDYRLNRVWEISARTLKLCMEDTFTDCPLYEQTLWVGDARNESLFAFPVFGAWDLVRRCIRISGHSLEKFPITGCQVPSGWDCLLPAWSFLWGISVWDYYYETADAEFLREAWPWVEKNLDGSMEFIDPATGLLSIPAWNLFDWSKTDGNHKILLFNSMFLCGAINAALQCAEVLGNSVFIAKFKPLREKLVQAINRTWLVDKQAYPDSIHEDGTVSGDVAVHTSFLSILYDVIDTDKFAAAKKNTLTPGAEMIRVNSPFASLYLYEALEKLGEDAAIVDAIYRDYQPMLDLGASTVWETYGAVADDAYAVFPTRSHCHGWSAAPLMFLNRIVIGLKMTAPGARRFSVSPLIYGLEHARGDRATVHGPISVSWKKSDGILCITAVAPVGVELAYVANRSHEGLKVIFNGNEM